MTAKSQLNARISDHTRAQLDALCATMGETQTGVIAIAIDRMARDKGANSMITVTSNITGDEYDLVDLEKSFGTLEHDGKTIYLLGQAVADNYGTDGMVRYYADAIDADGVEYRVAWDTTEDWDLAEEFARLMAKSDPSDDEIARIEELADMVLPDVSDESNACNWDTPISVEAT